MWKALDSVSKYKVSWPSLRQAKEAEYDAEKWDNLKAVGHLALYKMESSSC